MNQPLSTNVSDYMAELNLVISLKSANLNLSNSYIIKC